ncbi:MAG: heme-binding domain-containing protein [Geobacteraceae bacterium]
MKSPRRNLSLAVIIVTLVLIQLAPVERSNPPVEAEITAPDNVMAILHKACYDCHSNLTVWPWYSSIAPVSWLLVSDVREGRAEVNFTTWNRYPAKKQSAKRKKVWEEVKDGEMPPLIYRLMHPKARLSDREKDQLRSWSAAP